LSAFRFIQQGYCSYEDLPKFSTIDDAVQRHLRSPKVSLEEIREFIAGHLIDCYSNCAKINTDADVEGLISEAQTAAFNVVDDVIARLAVTEGNCNSLKDYVSSFDSLGAYDRLLTDFSEFLDLQEYKEFFSRGKDTFIPEVTAHWDAPASFASLLPILLTAVVQSQAKVPDGRVVTAIAHSWNAIVDAIQANWNVAFEIPPATWEELIAGALDRYGFDEVILTPRSGDFGRDVIAVKCGVFSMRVIASVKAYSPQNAVRYEDVRSLLHVLTTDPQASKAIMTTTSQFPPNLMKDRSISQFLPYRLELVDGNGLGPWLARARKSRLPTW